MELAYYQLLETILIEAGKIIISLRNGYPSVKEKTPNEIVTPADILANQYIIKKLKTSFPDIPIYSEEGNEEKSEAQTRWIVDPLDGTTPWVWGNSGFSISVALENDGSIMAGAVYDPVMREFYYAEKGKGATKNGVGIETKKGTPKNELLMVVDWGNNMEKREEGLKYLSVFLLPEMYCLRIVPQFAPALGLCRIAEGRIHALVCNDTWVEDHAAGALIISESGGYVSNFYQTSVFNHRNSGILACNERGTHAALVEFLTKNMVLGENNRAV